MLNNVLNYYLAPKRRISPCCHKSVRPHDVQIHFLVLIYHKIDVMESTAKDFIDTITVHPVTKRF